MATNFFGQIRNQMAGTRNQMFQNEMKGREFNVNMDNESRRFYGEKADTALQNVIQDYSQYVPDKDSFGFGNTGGQSFTTQELFAIAGNKFDEDNKGREISPGEREAYQDSYVTRFFNDTGFSSVIAGPNKIAGKLNYDSTSGKLSPDLVVYDPERKQVYQAPMTLNGGQKVSEGGEPLSVSTSAVDLELRQYLDSIRKAAGKDVLGSRLMQLYEGPSQEPTFDGSTVTDRRRALEETYKETPPPTTETTTEVPTETGSVMLTPTSDSGAINNNTKIPRPFNAEELNNNLVNPTRFMNQLDADNTFVYQPGTIPFLSSEQFNSYSDTQQKKFIEAAQLRSDANIKSLYDSGISEIKGGRVNPAMLEDAEATLARQQEIGDRGAMAGGTAYIEQAQAKVDRLKKLDLNNQLTSFYSQDVLKVLQKNPEYFAEFKELGAEEFGLKYKDNPEFGKNTPSKKDTAQYKVAVNNVSREIEKSGVNLNSADLKFAKPVSTAVENTVAALITDRADNNIDRVNFTDLTAKQRFALGYTILGSMPKDMRTDRLMLEVNNLIEYGVMSTRLDRTPKPTEVADDVRLAMAEDRQGRPTPTAPETGQEFFRFVTDRLIADNPQRDDQGAQTVFTEARGLRDPEDVREFIAKPEFKTGINTLFTQLNSAVNADQAVAVSGIVDNAIYALARGLSDNNARLFNPPSWAREVLNFFRGDVAGASGDLAVRMVAIGDDGNIITDYSQIKSGRQGSGVRVKAFRVLGPTGIEQRGVDISPGQIQAGQGRDFYNLFLTHAIANGSQNARRGG